MAREKFHRKRYFFHEKDSRFNTRIIRKSVFSLDKYQLKIWVENTGFAIQYIGNRKSFTKVLPHDQTIPFATVAVLHFTHNIKMHDRSRGGTLKQFIINTY